MHIFGPKKLRAMLQVSLMMMLISGCEIKGGLDSGCINYAPIIFHENDLALTKRQILEHNVKYLEICGDV